MYYIKFSHRYKKMPAQGYLTPTHITDVVVKHYDDLTPEFIEADTAIEGGGHYSLPHTYLIVISLWSTGIVWQTVRPYTPAKYDFYKSLKGSEVGIEIAKPGKSV